MSFGNVTVWETSEALPGTTKATVKFTGSTAPIEFVFNSEMIASWCRFRIRRDIIVTDSLQEIESLGREHNRS